MAGLVPAIHAVPLLQRRDLGVQLVIKVMPIRIKIEDKAYLPSARPMLHVAFALDRVANVREGLIPYKPIEGVTRSESVDCSAAMLPNSTAKIVRYAEIERPIWPVGDDVDPPAAHGGNLDRVDGRDKPGQDGAWG